MSERIIADVQALRKEAPVINLADRTKLILNLVWLHQIVVASENLMALAAAEAHSAAKVFRTYMTTHLEEERHHAEWLADDLRTVGVNVKRLPLNRSAVELAGSQYYLIHHVSPAAILGYMAVLEGFTFPLDMLEQLEAIHGKELLRCLRYHAENDLEHRKELFKVIDELDDPIVYDNAIRTQLLMNEAFRAYAQ